MLRYVCINLKYHIQNYTKHHVYEDIPHRKALQVSFNMIGPLCIKCSEYCRVAAAFVRLDYHALLHLGLYQDTGLLTEPTTLVDLKQCNILV